MVLKNRDALPQKETTDDEHILIPMNYPEIADHLMSMAVMMRNKKLNRGLIGINVVYEDNETNHNLEKGRRLLEQMTRYANSMNVMMQTQVRISNNISNSIKHAFNEFQATEIIMGLHTHWNISTRFWGEFHQKLFNSLSRQIIMARINQPLNTMRRLQIAVPSRAEYEPGFYRWVERIARLGDNIECRMTFYGRKETLSLINEYMQARHPKLRITFTEMIHWNELPTIATTIAKDHLFIVVTARKGTISYKNALDKLPEELTNHFAGTNLMIIFPDQYVTDEENMTVANPEVHAKVNS